MGTNSREYARRYYQEHKEQIAAYQRSYHKKKRVANLKSNPGLFDMRVDYKSPTKEDFQAVKRQSRAEYMRDYYAKNRDKIRTQQKSHRQQKKEYRPKSFIGKVLFNVRKVFRGQTGKN